MDKIKQWLVPLLQSQDCSLSQIEWDKSMNPPILRIAIDSEKGPVDLELCARLSELISEKLDEIDFSNGEYILEVCSSGVEKVINWEDLEAHKGEYIRVELSDPKAQPAFVEGTLEAIDPDQISIRYFIKGRPKKETIAKEDISLVREAIKI